MKRWVWRILLAAAALAALTVGALAAEAEWPEGLEVNWEDVVTGYDGEETTIEIPAFYTDQDGDTRVIKGIGPEAFKGKELVNVTIDAQIKEIGKNAFSGCASLRTVTFLDCVEGGYAKNSYITIGESAFEGCSSLEKVTLSGGIKEIGKRAFAGCDLLESIVISSGVTKIDEEAFAECGALSYVTFLRKSMTVESNAFPWSQLVIHCMEGGSVATTQKDTAKELHLFKSVTEKPSVSPKYPCVSDATITASFTCEGFAKTVDGKEEKEACAYTSSEIPFFASKGKFSQSRNTSPVKAHNVESDGEYISPTCKATGVDPARKCTVCGKVYKQREILPVNSNAHNFYYENLKTENVVIIEPLCEQDGYAAPRRLCEFCGEHEEIWKCTPSPIFPGEPNYPYVPGNPNYGRPVYPGDPNYVGEDCQTLKAAIESAADADEKKAAIEEYIEHLKGNRHNYEIEAIPAAHQWEETPEYAVTKAATCEEAGVETLKIVKTCKACGKIEREYAKDENGKRITREIKALGHDFDEENTTVEYEDNSVAPTCDTAGKTDIKGYCKNENKEVHYEADIPALGSHTWGENTYNVTTPATCTEEGEKTLQHTCSVCNETEDVLDKDGNKQTQKADALGHDFDRDDPENHPYAETGTEATCTEDGEKTISGFCKRENKVVTETVEAKALGHKLEGEPDEITRPATCTASGLKNTGVEKCTNPGCDYVKVGEMDVVIPALGHKWGNFVPNPGQDAAQAEDCAERTVTGAVSCERDGCGGTEERAITIPGKMSHNWGEWAFDTEKSIKTRTCRVCGKTEEQPLTSCAAHTWDSWTVVTEPTSATEGLRKHVCKVCGAEETVKIPATGGSAADPGKPDPNAQYTITVTAGSGGTAAVSATKAKAGTSVTVSVSPHSGFELDMIRVTGSSTAKDLTGGQRSFTMPASDVNVTVSFSPIDSGSGWGGASNGAGGDPARSKDNTPVQITPQSIPRASAWGQIFSDIPAGHWAAGEINWANRMGYMNGTEGLFNPDEAITCQQMWMVLARLTGSYPANMADARRWAVEGGFADGSSPTAPVARHQLVTALYRCAYLKGGVSRSNASLAGYADSRVVPSAARDAFAWAVANGIVSGTSGNRLEPNGTLTRAQFAVILYRYSQRV